MKITDMWGDEVDYTNGYNRNNVVLTKHFINETLNRDTSLKYNIMQSLSDDVFFAEHFAAEDPIDGCRRCNFCHSRKFEVLRIPYGAAIRCPECGYTVPVYRE